jgi:tRNA-splicing ligase RtcB
MAWTVRFLEDVALADLAFEAIGESLEDVFRGATQALVESMANPATVPRIRLLPIAKVERYAEGLVVVHRKGATRAFGPGSPELPEVFRQTGQPVICGGSMETGSYLLVGTDRAVRDTFGSTMHGSGRTMSRAQAKRTIRGRELQQQMPQRGILVKAVSMSGLAEEAGLAYKNISDVVESVERAGITKKVLELRPIGNIKG